METLHSHLCLILLVSCSSNDAGNYITQRKAQRRINPASRMEPNQEDAEAHQGKHSINSSFPSLRAPGVALNPTQDPCSSCLLEQKARSSHLMMWNTPLGSVECAFTHGRLVATCAASTPQSEVFLTKHPGLVLNKRTPAAGLSSTAGASVTA